MGTEYKGICFIYYERKEWSEREDIGLIELIAKRTIAKCIFATLYT